MDGNITDESLRFWLGVARNSSRRRHLTKLLAFVCLIHSRALVEKDCDIADTTWYIKTVLQVYMLYFRSFNDLKNERYYNAWCIFEKIEMMVSHLRANSKIYPSNSGVGRIARLIAQWQKLYPYKVFMSPEIIVSEKRCSICDEPVGPRSECRHLAGKIYCGRLCYRRITKFKPVSVSMVTNPVQKYSVVFATHDDGKKLDHYDYSAVKFAIDRLVKPFHNWTIEWGLALHPHDLFLSVLPEDSCPCSSGSTYSQCCLHQAGVTVRHAELIFDVAPDASLPNLMLPTSGPRINPPDNGRYVGAILEAGD